jgi:hypothetical protein
VTTDAAGKVILTLTGVPEDEAIPIEVEASSVAGFESTKSTTQVVAFVTVDLEIAFSYKLTVQGGGNGNGTVTSLPSGISCDISGGVVSGDDNESYEFGTQVTLTADPLEDSTFDGWSGGGCGTTNPCIVTMDQAHTVTADFAAPGPADLIIDSFVYSGNTVSVRIGSIVGDLVALGPQFP